MNSRGAVKHRPAPQALPSQRFRLTLCWRRESQENPSLDPNSLLAGKIQGISSIRRLSGTSTAEKRDLNQALTDKFPTHLNREIFWALQGIKSGDQGTFRPDQGSPLWRAIWCGFPGTRLSTKSASEFADHITGCH